MITLENTTCKLEIERNPKKVEAWANIHFSVKLISGSWPDNTNLITICDNLDFTSKPCHFGGKVERMSDDQKYVTVYID